ncbi:MAG: M15 family peptidase [Streptosporangiales bacterium]|nr:M15 family peptidase [Streptosporangiales bacterium]
MMLAACGSDSPGGPAGTSGRPTTGATSSGAAATSPASQTPVTVRPLGAKNAADLLVRGRGTLTASLRTAIDRVRGVGTTLTFAAGTTTVNGTKVTVAAVDPSTFRSYAPTGTAESDALWQSVARGELAVMHTRARTLALSLGAQADLGGTSRRVGAFATTLPGIDVVVSDAVGRQLGLRGTTGLVASVGRADPGEVGQRVTRLVGKRADVDLLTAPAAVPRSFLTGNAAAQAFGTFSYRYSANGTISPDPQWVRANIRTETVPLLGKVTCHRLMLPQLRGALEEVVRSGIAAKIHPDEYAGCYVPRFIESNPNQPISLHTWGIALDMNVPGNQRGTRGEMDRRVVAIFKKWGFSWGGDWSYTDPMHFELAALLKDPPS